MSSLNTLLFSVGIAIFMITIYGAVMAGGNALRRNQREELADDVEMIVNEDGYEVMTSSSSNRVDHAPDHDR